MHTGLVFRTVHTELFAFDKGRFKMYPKLFRRQARARQQQATRKKCVKLTMLLLMLWSVAEHAQTTPTPSSETRCENETLTCSYPGQEIKIHCDMAGMTGQENWTIEDDGCTRRISWSIKVPEGHGIILETEFRNKRDGDERSRHLDANFFLYLLNIPELRNSPKLELVSFDNVRLCFVLTTQAGLRSNTRSIGVSYTAYPMSEIPVKVYWDFYSWDWMYDCSLPRRVPEILQCDMIQQCIGGEDEPPTCEIPTECDLNWIPSGDDCLRIVGGDIEYPVSDLCNVIFDAKEASLVSQNERDLVVNALRAKCAGQMNFGPIAMSLKKVKPKSETLSHLYRFLWQWGGEGSPIAYHEAPFVSNNINNDCAVLGVSKEKTELQPITCDPQHVGDKADAYVCMKPKTQKGNQNREPTGVNLQPAQETPTGIHTKVCPDGSLVLTFHPCNSAEGWSERNLPLFPCKNGASVHYSLVCDGVDDCTDGSDGTMCRNARYSFISGRMFLCEHFQLVPPSFRCDGVPDCFDGSDEKVCLSCRKSVKKRIHFYDSYSHRQSIQYSTQCPGYGCFPYDYIRYMNCDEYNGIGQYDTPNITPPGKLELDGFGLHTLTSMTK
ncbi:hypothetical protein BaRGS_00025466, partial [Batillaria attramentaria]